MEGRLRLAEARQHFGDLQAARQDGQIMFLLAIQLGQQELRQAQEIYIAIGVQDGQARAEGRPVPPSVAALIAQASPLFARLGMQTDERAARALLAR